MTSDTSIARSLPVVGVPERDNHNKFIVAQQLHQGKGAKPRDIEGLYVHTPFCFHKCHYCDFYSLVEADQRDRQGAFTDRLIAETAYRAGQIQRLKPRTIFVGGGTPTLLRPDLWRQLLGAMATLGILEHVQEFTCEANPETVTDELMDILVAGGVNRISIGAQSFSPDLLKTLERWHDPASVGRAVATVRRAGITNINLDLIFAIPGQTLAMLESDLDHVLALEPTHLSCYGLTYEANTAMTQRLKLGQFQPVDEDVQRVMYQRVIDRLAAAGFEHYEVSNWARRRGGSGGSFRCEHNMVYWTNGNWLAVGPSGASHVDGLRWKNEAHLGRYLSTVPDPVIVDVEQLPADRHIGEMLMLSLRLRQGVALDWLGEHLRSDDARLAAISQLVEIKMLERTATHLRLTDRGLHVADSVIAALL